MTAKLTRFELMKWVANILYIISVVSMLSPTVAAHSYSPWIIYFVANVIWLIDCIRENNRPWMIQAIFYLVWDTVMFISRVYGVEVLSYLQPLVHLLEFLP
jgi:hypothetical protein